MYLRDQNAKILLIDDNPKNLQVAMGILDKEGYDLIYAQDGIKGLNLAKNGNFDLILLDIIMHDIDGYSVCQELKKDSKTEDIPVIFLTVKDEEQDMIKGFEYGGVDYITKPFYAEVLLRKVKTHINLFQTTRELKSLNENLEKTVKEQVKKIKVKEQMLFQQAKMASMGEMIANIAHQWRQPLSAISTTAIAIRVKLSTDYYSFSKESDADECIRDINHKLDEIEEYILTLSKTVDDFRNFFKPKKEIESFNIRDLIKKSLNLMQADLNDGKIEVIEEILDIDIVGIEGELSQVIINILNNAKDSILELEDSNKRLIFISTTANSNSLIISIKDSGGGVDNKSFKRIFDPYFTTKDQSTGTGIGLYMSLEIIKKHMHGDIRVENVEYEYKKKSYRGAKFIIEIPLNLKGVL